MEVVNFGHSVKDIPVLSKKEYRLSMIHSGEKFIRNLRWRVLHFLKPSQHQPKETFDFKSIKNPPQIPDIQEFANEFTELITSVEFENKPNQFQQKLTKEKEAIEKETKLIVGADKTSNYYKVDTVEYKDLLKKNVEKEYKKEKVVNVQKINKAHKKIAKNLNIQDRVFKTMNRECFISLKDHKENFKNNPKCRLLNPTKCELGKVSKQILTQKIKIIREKKN